MLKVESTAKLCFLDFNSTTTQGSIKVFPHPDPNPKPNPNPDPNHILKVFEHLFTAEPVSAACTAADTPIFLKWLAGNIIKSDPNVTDVSVAFSDPSCPPVKQP